MLAEGTAFAAALAEEVSIAKNRWWEQTRQPAGSPPGGEFADMGRGRGRSAGGGGGRIVPVSREPSNYRIVPVSDTSMAQRPDTTPTGRQPSPRSSNAEAWMRQPNAEFRRHIATKENSADKPNDGYGELNRKSGELGRYQLAPDSLVQIGWLKKTPQGEYYWTDKAKAQEVTSRDNFLRNPAAQEAAMTEYLRENERQLRLNGSKSFLGTTIVGLEGTFKISEAGLAAAAHRQGAKGVLTYLRTQAGRNFRSPRDMSEVDKIIETRLRQGANVIYEPPR